MGIAIILMGATMFIIEKCSEIKKEDTKQLAITNPAEMKTEVVERVVIKTITKEGDTVVVTKEIISSKTDKRPIVPDNTILKRKYYYVSGSYGAGLHTGFDTWGVALGCNLNSWLSSGIRYDTFGQEQRLSV